MPSQDAAAASEETPPGRDARSSGGGKQERPAPEAACVDEVDCAVEQALALVRNQSAGEPRPADRPLPTDRSLSADRPLPADWFLSADQPLPADWSLSADRPCLTEHPPSADRYPADRYPADRNPSEDRERATERRPFADGEDSARQPSSTGPGRTAEQSDPTVACAPGTRFPISNHEADRSRSRGRAGWTASWHEARAVAAREGRAVPGRVRRLSLGQALGHVLADPLVALTDLPPFDTSAMDGWVVTGPGPWNIPESAGSEKEGPDTEASAGTVAGSCPHPARGILAGHHASARLPDGAAVRIATGARIPVDANAVIRSEHGHVDEARGLLHARYQVHPGQDIRPQGQECRRGERLLSPGVVVTPAVLGLAAAAGYDELAVVPRPRVDVLVLGDELLTSGLPYEGLIRDALGPMIGPWLRALGASVSAPQHLGDDATALRRALTTFTADLVITTGGTASGPVDHVHSVLSGLGAELLVDGVAVRPGHPMLLAGLAGLGGKGIKGSRYVVGLPGNPLAAVSGLLTLAEPLLRGLAGHVQEEPYRVVVRDEVSGHPHDTRLVPVVHGTAEHVVPLRYSGPAMLRGIAVADGLVVVPPGGVRSGTEVELIELPWASAMPWTEGCFT
ncbi:molybdopterin-binding protein [Streptomyces sp. NPDC014734]|uniref:molybdopterin-binding protein n=1 Tax=Streptomyces sp. NPDC014734 TaxID=3364886 RepID=UPI0036F821A7